MAEQKTQAKQIINNLKELQKESLNTEKLVEEMCKEISVLDAAKNNITLSINCLTKYSDLQSSLETLRNQI